MSNLGSLTYPKVLRIPDAKKKTGMSRSSLYNKWDPSSKYYDPTFPKPIRLGTGPTSSVGLIESEIDVWIASRAKARGLVQETEVA